MKEQLCEMIQETGRKGELEQDKLFCLLLDMQENMRQDLAEDPDYRQAIELERLQTVTDALRAHIRQGRDIFDQLTGWLQRIERGKEKDEADPEDAEYPLNALFYMAVAEQEKDLQHLYPSKFGAE